MNEIVHDADVEELYFVSKGMSEDDVDAEINKGSIDDHLAEDYGISFENYARIVNDLIKMAPIVESALQGKPYHAFVIENRMVAKLPVE